MGFASLGSGSRGNGTVVALTPPGDDAATRTINFLVDCGFSLKQSEQRLGRLGLSGGDLDAIFVSHEHSDHIAGVAALAHKYKVAVFASHGTLKKSGAEFAATAFDGDTRFQLEGIDINPVCVPHDAREPTQFVFSNGKETVGVLSDLGCVTQHVVDQYRECTHLLMEANHDPQMLMRGSYPQSLKRRVGADYGHLSNEQALKLLDAVKHDDLEVVIGHVSEQNNRIDILEAMFATRRAEVRSLQIATQKTGVDWIGDRPIVRQVSFSELG
jgi:phosphoribosyl 1,2-cyclic phosphodiesterase